MKRHSIFSHSLSTIILGAVLVSSALLAQAAPEVGDKAPDFTLPGSDGMTYSLADFKDKAYVVVAFFPKAFTGG